MNLRENLSRDYNYAIDLGELLMWEPRVKSPLSHSMDYSSKDIVIPIVYNVSMAR